MRPLHRYWDNSCPSSCHSLLLACHPVFEGSSLFIVVNLKYICCYVMHSFSQANLTMDHKISNEHFGKQNKGIPWIDVSVDGAYSLCICLAGLQGGIVSNRCCRSVDIAYLIGSLLHKHPDTCPPACHFGLCSLL